MKYTVIKEESINLNIPAHQARDRINELIAQWTKDERDSQTGLVGTKMGDGTYKICYRFAPIMPKKTCVCTIHYLVCDIMPDGHKSVIKIKFVRDIPSQAARTVLPFVLLILAALFWFYVDTPTLFSKYAFVVAIILSAIMLPFALREKQSAAEPGIDLFKQRILSDAEMNKSESK